MAVPGPVTAPASGSIAATVAGRTTADTRTVPVQPVTSLSASSRYRKAIAAGGTSSPASKMGPGSNASPEAQVTRSTVNRSAQPRVLRKQSDAGSSLRPTRTTGTGAACCAPGHSSGGGRRTPGGTLTWTWEVASDAAGSATSRRAVRAHSGLRTPRVSPTAVVHSSSVTSDVSQPAMASGCPVAAASSTWASVTERTDRLAATSGKSGGGPSGTAGGDRGPVEAVAAVAAEAAGPGDEAGGGVSARGPARPATTAAASRTTGIARPIARRPRRTGPRGLVDAGWTIIRGPWSGGSWGSV